MEIGSIADWVGAVGSILGGAATAGALFYAAAQVKASKAELNAAVDKRADETNATRRAQALSVGVKALWKPLASDLADEYGTSGNYACTVTVQNSSPYAISGARLDVMSEQGASELVIGTVLPGESFETTRHAHHDELPFSSLTFGAELHFVDAFGVSWTRTPDTLVEREYPPLIC